MNSIEKYVGSKEDFYFFLKDEVIRLFKGKLKIEGTRVLIPDNQELNYEFEFVSNDNSGNFSINVKWGQKPEKTVDFQENSKEYSEEYFQKNSEEDSKMIIDKYLTMNNY